MSKLGALVRTGLKSNFGLSLFCHRLFKEKKDRWIVPVFGLSLLGAIPLFYALIALIKEMYSILKPIGQEGALLALAVLVGQLLILIFGIYYVLAAFYFSRDIEMLVPLPIKPSEVLLSKFIIITINEYLTVAVIVLPFLITFGVLDSCGFSYWLISALVYLALPLIPLAIISLIVVVMMRFINISRKKDALILIGGIAVLAAAFGFQILGQWADSSAITDKDMAAFFTSPDSLLHRIGAAFPPSIWAAKALAYGFSVKGLMNLAALLGASLLCLGAIIAPAEHLFYRGVVGLTETSGQKRLLTADEMSRHVSSGRRAIAAIFMREFRIMNRTPVFLLNGVLAVVILPAFFAFMGRADSNSSSVIIQKFGESGNSLLVILIMALFMVACGGLNGTSSSTFSREGTQFWISRVIPVAPREQIAAKFLHSYLVGVLGILAALVATVCLLPIRLPCMAAAVGLALITMVLMTAVGMLIDLARPLLDWTNPQKAIKNNINVLLSMFADAAIVAAAIFGIRALDKAGASDGAILFVLFIALSVFAALGYRVLVRFADKRYQDIDA
jgi:ABC-2 type transport system permease protein